MKILITEYFTSTFSPKSMHMDILVEGYSMAYTAAKLLKLANQEVSLTISRYLDVVEEEAIYIDPHNYYDFLSKCLVNYDGVIAVAPPAELIKVSEIAGGKLIGSPHDLTKLFSNKYTTYLALSKCGIRVPETILIKRGFKCSKSELSEVELPLVVKPAMLAGSECVYVAHSLDELCSYAYEAVKCDPFGEAVVQRYIRGVHGSISVVYSKFGVALFSLNLQLIGRVGSSLKYFGGVLPIRDERIVNEARTLLEKLFSKHPLLRGFIGLDVVWNDEGIYVVEVNPRLTTSILGVAELYPELGSVLVNSWTGARLEARSTFLGDVVNGYSYYLLSYIDESYLSSKVIELPQCSRKITVGVRETLHEALNVAKTTVNKVAELALG
ncbi:MAG: ATP-grasp domain-containing protein [Sulfolobales archaeon]|nr:ATP-grasp domain-containing protein [Sulfolobales archaeon]MCX8198449.1 ATP-grasp domain-containing protein [Sulfolobales archaeon]MDW8169523.1 ATP-grasp domain-containing protein [Desulfurococcaceae archaeon]